MKTIVLRVDDLGAADWRAMAIVSALTGAGYPLSCLVVPAWLDRPFAGFLARLAAARQGMLDLVQHGFAHVSHAPQAERAYEFGASRPREAQRSDVVAGRRTLERWFSPDCPRLFAPPHDRLNQDTLDVLAEQRFTLCHGSPRTFAALRIPDGMATLVSAVDAGSRRDGFRQSRPAAEVAEEIRACECDVVGVVLHPAEFVDQADFVGLLEVFDNFRSLGVRFATATACGAMP